jgi:hypothetical protein
MADGLFNVEILMRMSKNVRAQNEGWRKDVWIEGQERYRQVKELIMMFEQEYGNLEQELRRLEQYAPRVQESMPKVIAKGPANEPVQRQEAEPALPDNQVRR